MGDNDLSLKFGIDSDDAVAGVDAVNQKLADTTTEAKTASEAASAIGPAIAGGASTAAPALSDVDAAAQKLQASLDKLANTDTARGLVKGAADAKVALDQWAQSAAAAGVSQDQITQKTNAASAAIQDAATKSATLSKAMADVRLAGQQAANGLDAARASAGSLTSIFDSMSKTGGSAVKTIGDLGLGLAVGKLAFDGAVAAAKVLVDTLNSMIAKGEALQATQDAGRATTDLFAAANRALQEGLIANSDTTSGLVQNYVNLISSMGRGTDAANKLALAIIGVNTSTTDFAKTSGDAEKANSALEGVIQKNAQAQADLAAKTTAYSLAQEAATEAAASGTQTYEDMQASQEAVNTASDAMVVAQQKALTTQGTLNATLQQAEPALLAYQKQCQALGLAMPPAFRAALDAIESLKTKQDSLGSSMQDLTKKMATLPAAMQLAIDKEKELAAANQLVADASTKLIPSIQGILDKMNQEILAAKGSADEATLVAQAHATAADELGKYAAANQLTAEQVLKMVVAQGNLAASTTGTQAAIAGQIASLGALGGALDTAAAKTQSLAQQAKALDDQLKETNATLAENAAAIKARNDAIDAGVTATNNFAEAQKNGIAVEGQASIANMVLAKATDAQNTALVELLKNTNAYTDSLQKTLTVASGWNDYLAELTSSYQSGALSVLNYKEALQDFLTQLEQQFAGATGAAKASLDSMKQAILQLIQTAGAAPVNTDQSPSGALNAIFNGGQTANGPTAGAHP